MLDMLPGKVNARCKVRLPVCETSDKTARQPANQQTNTIGTQLESQQTSDKTVGQPTPEQTGDKNNRQPANHLKFAIKSKSLDVFDRPIRKLQLARLMSLSTMISIPENSCSSTWGPPILTEDDMVISHRSPVSIHNGYRAACKTGQNSCNQDMYIFINDFQAFLNLSLLKTL
jgi:hypothetical protein